MRCSWRCCSIIQGRGSPCPAASRLSRPVDSAKYQRYPENDARTAARRPHSRDEHPMLKLITILAASIPVILFLKNVFFRKSKVMQQASAEFRKQIDYLVWAILFVIGCGVVYVLGRLVYSMWS